MQNATCVYVCCVHDFQYKTGFIRTENTYKNTYKNRQHEKEDCAAGDKTVGWHFQQGSGKQGWQSQEKEL